MKLHFNKRLLTTAISLVLTGAVHAAAPDAGQTLQQLQQQSPVLPKTDSMVITAPSATSETAPGGAQIQLSKINIKGITVFNQQQLIQVLGQDVIGKSYDLTGLKQLANQISNYYRENGYPFARAFIPAQNMTNGELIIQILEGKYGQISTSGTDAQDNVQAKVFLESLTPNSVIESAALERATLILNDQPGIKTSPVVQPGKITGAGDLIINVKRDKAYTGSIGVDNHGNRYTGQNKLRVNFNINSPFMLGDQLTLNALYGDHQDKTALWFGGIGYNLPLNGNGLRAIINYSKTAYQIGKNFSDSQLKGIADIFSTGLSYPLIRSQKTNLTFSGNLQYKSLADDNKPDSRNVFSTENKSSISLPIALTFDTRDTLGGGGIIFGALTWTKGSLSTDKDYTDTNNTKGDFDKLNLDLVRLQSLSQNFTLFLRGSAQWSNKNLDSSEGFGIGGVTGVRAYPTGEGYGNVGWVTQTELRYALTSHFNPYAFYDIGSTTVNQTTVGTNSTREISGAGIGLRYTQDVWNADVSAAWRMNGGKPEDASTSDDTPRLWASVSYQL